MLYQKDCEENQNLSVNRTDKYHRDETRVEVEEPEIHQLNARLSEIALSEKPSLKWTDVAGLESVVESLKELILLPIKFPALFNSMRRSLGARNILLYGPPGTGKSLLARVVAAEAKCAFFHVKATDLVDKSKEEAVRYVDR